MLLPVCFSVIIRFSSWSPGCPSRVVVGAGKYNGFSLFWSTSMSNRVPLPGESQDACRRRVMAAATDRWCAMSPDEKAAWSYNARQRNSGHAIVEARNACVGPIPTWQETPNDTLIPALTASEDGHGPLGLGDSNWALAASHVEEAQSSHKGFVNKFSASWKNRAGGMVTAGQVFPSHTIHISCQEKHGFCV